MPTDDERREVARRLRNIDLDDFSCYAQEYEAFCKAIGLGDLDNDWPNRLGDLIEPQPITGDTSDGYHTFNELYDHRSKLFSVIVRCFKGRAWKSKLHHDGTMYEGMFIVGIETSQGQATYHYDIDPYWSVFDCKELARAPEWDGHTPEQAISRITSLRPSLADLIDPDTIPAKQDKTEHPLSEPEIDREALLALADEIDRSALEPLKTNDLDPNRKRRAMRIEHAQDLMAASSRIREALGVRDG